jgi:YggT family protein
MIELIAIILRGLQILIIVDAVLSWMMPAERFPRSLTTQITAPLYAPVRAILKPEKTGGLDLSPLLILLLIQFMQHMLARAGGGGF